MKLTTTLFFLLFLLPLSITAQKVDCQDFTDLEFYKGENVYAGLEIGSKGLKATIVRFGVNGQRVSFAPLIESPNLALNTNASDATQDFRDPLDSTIVRVMQYVKMFKGDPYRIPQDRIFILASSGLIATLAKQHIAAYFRNQIQLKTKLQLFEMSGDEEGSYKALHLAIDENREKYEYAKADNINVVDIGSRNISGAHLIEGNVTKSFQETDGSIKNVIEAVREEIKKNNMDTSSADGRYRVVLLAGSIFRKKYLPQIGLSAKPDYIFFGGGTPFFVTAWLKPTAFSTKDRLIQMRQEDVTYFRQEAVRFNNVDALFKSRANNLGYLSLDDRNKLNQARRVFGDKYLDVLVAAGLMDAVFEEFEAKGAKTFYFDNRMLSSALEYFLYLQYKNVLVNKG
jgi:hypothetical protein